MTIHTHIHTHTDTHTYIHTYTHPRYDHNIFSQITEYKKEKDLFFFAYYPFSRNQLKQYNFFI